MQEVQVWHWKKIPGAFWCNIISRQELATREHMLDHGQLGPATPASGTPAGSRRPSMTTQPLSRSSSGSEIAPRASRRSFNTVLGDSLSMASIQEHPMTGSSQPAPISEEPTTQAVPDIPPNHPLHSLRSISQQLSGESAMSTSALEDEDENFNELSSGNALEMKLDLTGATPQDLSIQASRLIGNRLSDSVISTPSEVKQNPQSGTGGTPAFFTANGAAVAEVTSAPATEPTPTTRLISPQDLAAQLFANPKIAALRSPPLTPSTSGSQPVISSSKPAVNSPPILLNPKCSGYFVEPVGLFYLHYFLGVLGRIDVLS